MGSVWIVKPEEDRIDLVYEDKGEKRPFWITVKRRLTVGETRRVMTAGWRSVSAGGGGRRRGRRDEPVTPSIDVDWHVQSFARTLAYLTGWSLEDETGKRLEISQDVIENLDNDLCVVIENAITAHIEAVEQQKKVPSGKPKRSPMSA